MFYFTPIPGFFSPFPHGTSSLSVTAEYLVLDDGPPGFPRGFSCPMVLGILLGPLNISLTRLSLSLASGFHRIFGYVLWSHIAVPQPRNLRHGLDCIHFARHYSEYLVFDFFSSG